MCEHGLLTVRVHGTAARTRHTYRPCRHAARSSCEFASTDNHEPTSTSCSKTSSLFHTSLLQDQLLFPRITMDKSGPSQNETRTTQRTCTGCLTCRKRRVGCISSFTNFWSSAMRSNQYAGRAIGLDGNVNGQMQRDLQFVAHHDVQMLLLANHVAPGNSSVKEIRVVDSALGVTSSKSVAIGTKASQLRMSVRVISMSAVQIRPIAFTT